MICINGGTGFVFLIVSYQNYSIALCNYIVIDVFHHMVRVYICGELQPTFFSHSVGIAYASGNLTGNCLATALNDDVISI